MYRAHLQFPPSQEGIFARVTVINRPFEFCLLCRSTRSCLPGRLIDLIIDVKAGHRRIRLSGEAKKDLRVWLTFLSSVNGRSFFLDDIWHSSDKLHLFTDAAGSLGFGAIFENHWCYGKWLWIGYIRILLFLNFIRLF